MTFQEAWSLERPVHGNTPVALSGPYYAEANEGRIRVYQMPSTIRGIERKRWILAPSIPFYEMHIDANAALLVLLNYNL